MMPAPVAVFKRLKCACVDFDGLEKLRNNHAVLETAIQKLASTPQLATLAAAQKAFGKTLASQIELHNRHTAREHGISRMGCEVTKMFAIDAPPDAPPRRVPYDVDTKPAAHVLKLVKASAKRKRKAAAASSSAVKAEDEAPEPEAEDE
jgi:hypothetical protein